jgi:hypothetical protein
MQTSGRIDIYAKIHKALRAQMSAAITAFARLDPLDADEVASVLSRFEALLGACAKHVEAENTYVHTAMEARTPGSTAAIADEHVHHEQDIARLRRLGTALAATAPQERTGAVQQLHQALCAFVADNFLHMGQEETHHNAVLWAAYTDAELLALEMTIVASLTPEQKAASMRWMLPAINHAERMGMLMGMRASAPPPAFAAALDLLRTELNARDWDKVARDLGLQAQAA